MRWTTTDSGTIHDSREPTLGAPNREEGPDAAGPEDDGSIEIDFVRGRLSMDLESLSEEPAAEGPHPDGSDYGPPEAALVPRHIDLDFLSDEVGPEFDLEHLVGNDTPPKDTPSKDTP